MMRRAIPPLVFVLALAGCDDLVADHSFDLWCGDTLCAWELEVGAIARAPTWHPSDYGVSFVGDEVAISQLADADLVHGCMRFDVVSHVETGAELRLELDFDDDGVLELERTLDRTDWERASFHVAAPLDAAGLRVRVAKYGDAEAILAMLRVRNVLSEEGCVGPAP